MSDTKYIVGLDLGTTHCVLAYTSAEIPDFGGPEIRLFSIPQLVDVGEVQALPLLPSFLLLPGPHDVPDGGLSLPWDGGIDHAVGTYARQRGAELPDRLIASAKSWLSHSGIDRTAPNLPWGGPSDGRKMSAVDAATCYLTHLRNAWNQTVAPEDSTSRLEDQRIFLTVPASFDAVAREMTVNAARAAGFAHLTLLEEPQAAFYAWIAAQGDGWRDAVNVGESILVCDVGGGTSDFSLIEVVEEDGNLDLQRVAVGDHLMLGGDNMDLTLAYAVRARLAQSGTQLDNWQLRALWHQCRNAKERLLNTPGLESEPVVVAGRGSALVGGTIRSELTQREVESVVLEGFFPSVEAGAVPEQKPRIGMREMGLPYESDPAITRHLAAFLGRQVSQAGGAAFPSAVLFNGGVMKAAALRERVLAVLRQWSPDGQVRELPSVDLDQAVARGATYYGVAREGSGIRIRAGAPQTYYIGVESAMPTVPGILTPMNALCVVPFGMEEGTDAQIRDREFGLVVGERALFHLFASNTRKTDKVGETIEDWGGELHEVATMETNLPLGEGESGGVQLPVWLESKVTEVGTLELWCVSSQHPDRRWKLEFNIREAVDA